jgi:hypothetical protein
MTKWIKYVALAGVVGCGAAFAAGAWVGWKTTMKAFDVVGKQYRGEKDAT